MRIRRDTGRPEGFPQFFKMIINHEENECNTSEKFLLKYTKIEGEIFALSQKFHIGEKMIKIS